jgi:hypothetical protein
MDLSYLVRTWGRAYQHMHSGCKEGVQYCTVGVEREHCTVGVEREQWTSAIWSEHRAGLTNTCTVGVEREHCTVHSGCREGVLHGGCREGTVDLSYLVKTWGRANQHMHSG